MTQPQFLNAIKILHSIDLDEMIEAGAIQRGDGMAWQAFRSNPSRFLMCADDPTADAIWSIIEQRNQPRTVAVAPGITRQIAGDWPDGVGA